MTTKKYNWDEIISNFQNSNLSQAEFCRQNDLDAKYLNLQLSKRNQTKSKTSKSKSAFIQATKTSPSKKITPVITIEINQTKIQSSHTDPKWLADFCKELVS